MAPPTGRSREEMDLDKLLNTKLQLLEFKQSKGKEIVAKKNITTLERHADALAALAREVDEVKVKIETKKLREGASIEEVGERSSGIDEKIEGVDIEVEHLRKCLSEARQHSKLAEKEKEDELLAIEREKQLQFEKEKLEMKLEYEKKSEEFKKGNQGEPSGSHAELPKLTITKFGGTFEEWLPFWNKFCVEIDATDLPPVTKFVYLKELVLPKVRADIDGLPFNTEGYERAKNILKSEYGKISEIINAYVNNIMGLPTIPSENPKEVDEFYKKLLYNVQSLERLGKLRDVSGNVRAVLDKLKGIKADLVRGQDGWQEWDFSQLLRAIKRWKEINPVTEESENTVQLSERMRNMSGIHVESLIKPNRKSDDSRGSVFIVIKPTTFPLNFPKWSRLEIGEGFSAESNYVLIAPVTDIELIAAGVTDAKTANVNTTRRFVTTQPNQRVEDF